MFNSDLLNLIGHTPMVQLSNLSNKNSLSVYGKLEMFNPAGSIKDRAAFAMLKAAMEKGLINQDSVIVESSSGNTGIALAQVCRILGLRFICVVDIHSQIVNRKIIKAYGGEIDLVERPHPERGFLGARMDRIQYLLNTIPNSYNCDQYRNLEHPKAHYSTMNEILEDLGHAPDYIFAATSTCGTLKGFSNCIRDNKLKTKIVAVDAMGSVIFGKPGSKKRLIPGHGASVIPPFYLKELEDDFIHITDLECIEGCRNLVKQEGLLLGGSSGAVHAAISKYAPKIKKGATCVAIFPDKGERYIDTIYSDEWVVKNFGNTCLSTISRNDQQGRYAFAS